MITNRKIDSKLWSRYFSVVLSQFLLAVSFYIDSEAVTPRLYITTGVASGDITGNSAVIWSRSNLPSTMHVDYGTDPQLSSNYLTNSVMVNRSTDYTGHIKLTNLLSDTTYYYRVWFSTTNPGVGNIPSSTSYENGSFKTAPDTSDTKSFNFVIGGDLGGQNYCRRETIGYPIFSIMNDLSPEFFIFNGDQIYADSSCSESSPNNIVGWKNIPKFVPSIRNNSVDWRNLSEVHDTYLKHWQYNRDDLSLKEFLRNTSVYSQLDDHEVLDNYGAKWQYGFNQSREGYRNLVKVGTDLFFRFSPLDWKNDQENLVYRNFRWGQGLDLFLLDSRSYRDRNDSPDVFSNKTLLGVDQIRWLEKSLLNSNATWKVISIPSPLSIPICDDRTGCDNWATDGVSEKSFSNERTQFLKFLDDNNIKNVIFVATDVHFPYNARIDQDFNGDGERLVFHELVNGPLSAAPLRLKDYGIDPSMNTTFIYNEAKILNFAHVTIQVNSTDNMVHLISEIVDINGFVRPESRLNLKPE